MKHVNRQSGFTLVELLLYIAIVPIVIGATVGLFYLSTTSRVKHETINEVQKQGAQIVNVISRDLQAADAITVPAAGASGATLQLTMPVAANNPTIYSQTATTLNVTKGANPATPLHNSNIAISGLNFDNLTRSGTNGNVKFSFTLTRINTSGRNEYDYNQTFYGSGSLRP